MQIKDGIVKYRIFPLPIQPTLALGEDLNHPASNTTIFFGKCDWARKDVKLLRNYDPINTVLLHPLKLDFLPSFK